MTEFKINSLTYNELIEEARTIASSLIPDWNFDDLNDPVRAMVEIYLRAIEQCNWFSNEMAKEFNIITARDPRSLITPVS